MPLTEFLLCIESALLWLPLLLRHQWHIVGRVIPVQINVLNLRGSGYSLLSLRLGLLLQVMGHLLLHQFGVSLLLDNICQNHCITNSDPWCHNVVANCAFALSESTILVCGMMGQQLPAGLYRIGTTMDKIWSRVNADQYYLLCHVGWEWVQTMARKATCEGITVYIWTSLELSAHGRIGWFI